MSIKGKVVRIFAYIDKKRAAKLALRMMGMDASVIEDAFSEIERSRGKTANSNLETADEEVWRTSEEGKHFKLESTTGEIKAGFGGKHNGQKIGTNWNSGRTGGTVSQSHTQESGLGQKTIAGSSSSGKTERSAFQQEIDKKRGIAAKWSPERQAEYLFRQGFLTEDEAVEAMETNTAGDRMNDYFNLMEYNGDPTPTKPLRRSPNLDAEIRTGLHGGDWEQARMDYIQSWTGESPEEAKETLKQFTTWFGGSWHQADTNRLDSYIDADGAYDGQIYRGMHFTEEEYAAFMKDVAPGSRIGMNGYNSSWTNDREVAWGFSQNGDRHVIIHCMRNKTSAPVSHLSTKGEDEILAHSRTQWTVLGVKEGSNRTEITVMEAAERMSEEKRDQRRSQSDAAPEEIDHDSSLGDRMNAQAKFMTVTPPPAGLFEHWNQSAEDGGPGSGNWGHKGRPGKRGGSGKGGGKGLRSGSKESGYSSFAKTAAFAGLTNLARKHNNKNSYSKRYEQAMFWNDLKARPDIDKALQEQHKAVSPDESYGDYVDRIYNMLVDRVSSEKTPESIHNLHEQLEGMEKLDMKVIQLRNGLDPARLINNETAHEDKRRYLEIVGNHTGWSNKLVDRRFKNLTNQEKADMNALLDKHPWSDDPKQARIPNEKELYESESPEVVEYYNALKAKALGIGGVYVPERPKELDEVAQPSVKTNDWEKKLSSEEREMIDSYCKDYESLGDFLNNANKGILESRKKKVLETIADKTDWQDRMKERDFENLNDQELKDINYLLDKFPWNDDPKYKNIANEDELFSGTCRQVRDYYAMLKAKSLGIDGVTVPERPKELEYAMTHPDIKTTVAAQDGGYVHTPAGNENRKTIKQKMQAGKLANMGDSGMPEEQASLYRQALLDSVDSMDDRVAELVNMTMDKANILWSDSDGVSHYSGGDVVIQTKLGDEYRSPEKIVATLWHEYGHYMDDVLVSGSNIELQNNPLAGMFDSKQGPTSIAMTDGQYKDAAQKDVQALLDAAGLGDRYEARQVEYGQRVHIFRKADGQLIRSGEGVDVSQDTYEISEAISDMFANSLGYDRYKNYFDEYGAPVEPKWSDYMETYTTPKRNITRTREKHKGAELEYINAMRKYEEDRKEWVRSIGGDEEFLKLAHQREDLYHEYERKQEMMGYVTDCIDEAVQGEFGLSVIWGAHDIDYYRKKGVPLETSANVFSILARNNPDEMAFMKKFIPNISEVVTKAWRCGKDE